MKVSFLVLMFFIGFNCYAQYPKGLPSPSSNGWSKVGYSQADSGMIQIQRDTFNAKYPTVIRYLDGNLWQTLGNGARWSALKGSSISAVYAGNGLIKVNDSTLRVDTSSIATRLRVQKGIDSLGGVSVKYADTASMLSKYYNQTAINSRLALKVNYTDTTTMMSGYYRSTNPSGYITSSAITGKVNYTDTSTMLSAYYNKTAADGRFVHLTGNETIGGTKTFNTRVNVIATNSGNAYILNGMDYTNTYHIAYLGQSGSNTGYLALADNLGNQATFINGNGYSKINDNTYNAYGVGVGFAADNGSGAKLQVNGGVYASSYVKSGGTSTQYLMADGSVTTSSGLFTYNVTDPNGGNGSSYTPSNYPVSLQMGGFYGGYISVTTSSFTVNGNYRLIELKSGASSVNVNSAATGQDYFIFNSTGSAISISFTLKDLTGTTLTTIPANTSYHIFYNGTNYIKI